MTGPRPIIQIVEEGYRIRDGREHTPWVRDPATTRRTHTRRSTRRVK